MQTTNSNQNEESGKTPEDLIGVLLIIVVAIGLALWLGAQSASFFNSGSLLPPNPEGIGAILWNTVTEHPGDPASAWPEPHRSQLPGAWLYWPVTFIVLCAIVWIVLGVRNILNKGTPGLDDGESLGRPIEARFAILREVKLLWMGQPTSGRYALGMVGNRVIATESRNSEGQRRTIAGPVLHCGSSQSGKTTDAIAALKNWEGPAVVLSVKGDLAAQSIDARRRLGDVQAFDPSGLNSFGCPGTWNPLDSCTGLENAQRMAKRLIDSTDQGGNSIGDFWSKNSVTILAALLLLANGVGKPMAEVHKWVFGMDEPTEDGPGEVASYIKSIAKGSENERLVATIVSHELKGVWKSDSKMKSSYYVTMRSALAAWSRTSVQVATASTTINRDWLMTKNVHNTVYITTPLMDEDIMPPVVSALVADIVDSFMEINQRICLLYTSPSPRDRTRSRMPSSA